MKKNGMKILAITLLLLTILTVVLTFVIVAKLTHSASAKEDTSFAESFSGTLCNAYLYEDKEKQLIVLYEGKYYVADKSAASDYTGVADVEITDGKITKIYAKAESIEGTLDSYSEQSVQINGYEALTYDETLPVYLVAGEQMSTLLVRQKSLDDLVVGNSKVRLVVAEHKACALIQTSEEAMEHIRVLIKNKDSVTYPNLYVKSDQAYRTDETNVAAGTVVNAKSLLKEKKTKEVLIEPGEGMLYLCDKEGKELGSGYAGSFLVRKAAKGYVLVNELPVEDYVRYVLPSEMPLYFDYEALKAQAVCARTFAYEQMKSTEYAKYGANLDNTTSYQVYHATDCSEITDQAVLDTTGMVLTYENCLINCYYYSTSAGYSEDLEVWNTDSPHYLVAENHTKEKTVNLSKKRNFHKFITRNVKAKDMDSPYYRWTAELSDQMAMDSKYGHLKKLEVKERSRSGYVLSLRAVFESGERIYDKENEIRFFLGTYLTNLTLTDGTKRTGLSSVPSACFEITSQKKGKFVLTGGGFGHDIGMSQYGADAMGRDGKSWKEILEAYYKDAKIQNIFDVKTNEAAGN